MDRIQACTHVLPGDVLPVFGNAQLAVGAGLTTDIRDGLEAGGADGHRFDYPGANSDRAQGTFKQNGRKPAAKVPA
ncbi:hypothetical protein [Blastomonas aquatica]|uniref:hypothetical protein n=1 Tax=Blastomonas aquatica TaxID=1510276 RepID=UPI001E532322|nr:hypothetical protein [Blastomonas aquatica]